MTIARIIYRYEYDDGSYFYRVGTMGWYSGIDKDKEEIIKRIRKVEGDEEEEKIKITDIACFSNIAEISLIL